ncbi:MAG TPA: fluoride efflux transporter CrcB [Candidatus Gastranaerophilaceae bacterium]|nr:fluoride efflux transporter CrcB [Candidatus Gastranaerophilaceae bacterium]HPT41709.1 fluoride efflux transporter CrcB [Candidatus Gastranaerophilaceae bacterium]
MINIIAVFLGGGLGSLARYFMSILLRVYSMDFPFATLAVNMLGCFILGLVVALFWENTNIHEGFKLALTVGFCGGFTTFSTFSGEVFALIKQGDYMLAFIYVIISVIICLLATILGAFLARYV